MTASSACIVRSNVQVQTMQPTAPDNMPVPSRHCTLNLIASRMPAHKACACAGSSGWSAHIQRHRHLARALGATLQTPHRFNPLFAPLYHCSVEAQGAGNCERIGHAHSVPHQLVCGLQGFCVELHGSTDKGVVLLRLFFYFVVVCCGEREGRLFADSQQSELRRCCVDAASLTKLRLQAHECKPHASLVWRSQQQGWLC